MTFYMALNYCNYFLNVLSMDISYDVGQNKTLH